MKIINAKVYTIEEITQEDLNNLALERNTLVQENEELKSQLRGTTHCFDEEEHNKLKEEITNLSKDVDMWNAKYNDMFDENKRLKEALETKLYCKYANKCDELDDCSREEYEDMANANTKLSAENYDLQEENQELKEKLDKYENPRDMTLFAMWCTEKVKDENQELKLELSGYRQAILNNKEMLGLKEQNEKLKKQLENCYCNRTDCSGRIKDSKVYDSLVQKVETQQKEFIKYLEDEIKTLEKDILETIDDMDKYMKEVKSLIIEEILQKYKSIIGVSDENTIK